MRYVYVAIYARNAVLSKDTQNILTELESLSANAAVKKWVDTRFKRYLIEEYGSEIYSSQQESDAAWVKEALANGETVYYVNVTKEDYAQYKKYVQFLNTLPQKQLTGLSVAGVAERYKRFIEKRDSDEINGVKTVYKFSDGYKVVELITERALQQEAKNMANCIAKPEYWARIVSGEQRHFSLRDMGNDSHITIEYNVWYDKVTQVKGYANNKPDKEYYPKLVKFLQSLTNDYQCADYNELGIVFINGKQTTLEDALSKGLEMDNVVLPRSYGIEHPDIDDIKATGDIYTNMFRCNSVKNVTSKSSIWLSGFNCSNISNLQAPDIVLANSKIQNIERIISREKIAINGGHYGIIGDITCTEATVSIKAEIDRIEHLSSKHKFGILRSTIKHLNADDLEYLTVNMSTVGIKWKNIKHSSFKSSNVTLLDSNIRQNIEFDSCNVQLQNSECNSVTIVNSNQSVLSLDRNSSISILRLVGTLNRKFLENIKKYASKIGCVLGEADNRRAILDAGFKFKTLKQEIKSNVPSHYKGFTLEMMDIIGMSEIVKSKSEAFIALEHGVWS